MGERIYCHPPTHTYIYIYIYIYIYCIRPSYKINSVTIFSEFELLFLQLLKFSPVSQPSSTNLKTRLADLAHGFANTTVDAKRFLWQRNHFEVANGLKRNSGSFKNIV